LGLADQLADHSTGRAVADDPPERMPLRALTGLEVPGVGKDELGVDAMEIAVEREGALGRPPLVDRHLAGARDVGDLLDRHPSHPVVEQQFGRRLEDLLAHLRGGAPTASASWSIVGHRNLLLGIYGRIVYLTVIWTHRTQRRRSR